MVGGRADYPCVERVIGLIFADRGGLIQAPADVAGDGALALRRSVRFTTEARA